MTLPRAYVTHQTDHRIRVRIPEKKKSQGYFSKLERVLEKCEGVEGIKTSPGTASALIFHSGNVAAVWEFACHLELFELGERPLSRRPAVPTLEAGIVAGLGVYQLLQGIALPPAWTLFGQAISLLREGGSKRDSL